MRKRPVVIKMSKQYTHTSSTPHKNTAAQSEGGVAYTVSGELWAVAEVHLSL